MKNTRIYSAKRGTALAVAMALLAGASNQAIAVDDNNAILLQELKKRDAVISQLMKRVEDLENRVQDTVVWVGAQPDGAIVMRQIDELQNQLEDLTEKELNEGTLAANTGGSKKPRGPGAVEVDEVAAERALERTLTTTGALLLPEGVYEVAPYFAYSHSETENFANGAALGALTLTADPTRVKTDQLTFGVNAKIGLPFESQLELGLPYRITEQESVLNQSVLPAANTATDTSDSGLGDLSIGLAKTLVREDGWVPDLIGRFTWDTDSGEGLSFNEYTISLTALKRQDPLAFTAALSYTISDDASANGVDIQPGDRIGLSLGASLAASPYTSLSFTLAQSWSQETERNGVAIDGSDATVSQFLIGASSSLTRETLMLITAGIGLTDSAPDYSINLSFPTRFY